jgi:hypothetical protein
MQRFCIDGIGTDVAQKRKILQVIICQALKAIEESAHRRLKGERARGLSISQDRF